MASSSSIAWPAAQAAAKASSVQHVANTSYHALLSGVLERALRCTDSLPQPVRRAEEPRSQDRLPSPFQPLQPTPQSMWRSQSYPTRARRTRRLS